MGGYVRQDSTALRVALMTNGALGDVQPMVALAVALKEYDYEVCMFVPQNSLSLCSAHGIEAVPAFVDCQELMRRCGGLGGYGADDAKSQYDCKVLERELIEWRKEHKDVCIMADTVLEEFRPTLIVKGCDCDSPTKKYQRKYDVPVIPLILNRKDINDAKKHGRLAKEAVPVLYAVSEAIDPEPLGQEMWLQRVGPLVLKQEQPFRAMSSMRSFLKLQAFLRVGNAPVVIGWGSMQPKTRTPTEMLGMALRALKENDLRGVIIGGWAGLHDLGRKLVEDGSLEDFGDDAADLADFARDRVMFVGMAPHDWLLPLSRCIVHHGGTGTMQSALRAGIPQVITPIWHDQFDAAARVENMRLGYGFTKTEFGDITADDLANAIRVALKHSHKEKAMTQANSMDTEHGAERAAGVIDGFIKSEVHTGNWTQHSRESAPRRVPNRVG